MRTASTEWAPEAHGLETHSLQRGNSSRTVYTSAVIFLTEMFDPLLFNTL